MSRHPHDELGALERRADPAWLWDAERNRLVWANRAGLAFWSEATVLDLIDRRLDDRDAAVIRMESLVSTLEPGAETVETLVFDIDGHPEALHANCRRVILEDGRPALLIVRTSDATSGPAPQETRASLLEAVIAQMPAPVAVFDRHGSLLYQNDAAREGLHSMDMPAPAANADVVTSNGADAGSGLFGTWLGNTARAEELMSRALSRGSFSQAEVVQTRYGPRTHRIYARRLAAPVVGGLAVFMVLEDIEDRRRHELRQAETLAALEAIIDAADATFEIDADGRLVDIGGGAERIFGAGIGVLIGTPWDDVLAAIEIET
ncbi:MAG: PAS domain-containing protein, partial [Hyphomicrobiales bacterium]